MGSKKTVTQQSSGTQTVAPPSWTMPGIADASARVTAALGQVGNLPAYQGPFVAQPDMGLVDAAKAGYTTAAAAAPDAAMQIQNAVTGLGGLKPVMSSYDLGGAYDIAPAIQAATNPIFKQLTEQTLPGLRSSALESGAYTGDRAMSVVPSQVIGAALKDAQDTAAQIGLTDYTNRENRRLQAYGLDQQAQQFNNTFGLQTAQALPDLLDSKMKMLSSVGDLNAGALDLDTAAKQAAIDDAMQRNDYAIKYPFQGLDIASALLSQLSGNYGTTTSNNSSKQVQSTSGLGNVVQGLAGLASLAGSIPLGGGATLGGKVLGSLFKKGA